MNLTPISEVRVGVLQEDGTAKQVPVSESPYFKCLQARNEYIFDDYLDVLRKVSPTFKDEMDVESFFSLEDGMRNGFVVNAPKIRFDENLVCLDGHHRLAILLHIHNGNVALEIVNNEVQSVWVKSSKS